MNSLCPYKDIFGKPGEGAHKTRFLGMAAVDFIGTLIIALIISLFTKINFFLLFAVIFIAGEFLHYLFCVDTTFIKYIKKLF